MWAMGRARIDWACAHSGARGPEYTGRKDLFGCIIAQATSLFIVLRCPPCSILFAFSACLCFRAFLIYAAWVGNREMSNRRGRAGKQIYSGEEDPATNGLGIRVMLLEFLGYLPHRLPHQTYGNLGSYLDSSRKPRAPPSSRASPGITLLLPLESITKSAHGNACIARFERGFTIRSGPAGIVWGALESLSPASSANLVNAAFSSMWIPP